MQKELTHISKLLSLVLRHKPEEIGLQLDKNGWADVDELIGKVNANSKAQLDFEKLQTIVGTNNKQRFAFNEDQTRIRANQGHSIEVDLQLEPVVPPPLLYHGTAAHNVESILTMGIEKKSRQYVHLSETIELAFQVGQRHGKPIILIVNAHGMHQSGCRFYCSENKIWLTEEVKPEFLRLGK